MFYRKINMTSYDVISYLVVDYYSNTHDSVGNTQRTGACRMTQVTDLSTTTYTYDNANRMILVDGVTYTWDDTGNLLNDGVSTYTYDVDNRLTSITAGTETSSYIYNGLGDRLTQTVAGVTTHYTLDLNAGLTQVLTDGTHTYYYGLSRLGQKDANTMEFFLGDALGSVKQMVDYSGDITLSKSYTPFGNVIHSSGDGVSIYGYTGEVSDESGLVYLRARYYMPVNGRFIARDFWNGNYGKPLSLNKFNYVEGNPINLVDPSGYFPTFCHYSPNGALYELCVLAYYGLEPISVYKLGEQIKGSHGCYYGIINYRSSGYLEGIEGWLAMMRGGFELVYDFATMERMRFGFWGFGLNDAVDIGSGVSFYGGHIEGLRSDTQLSKHYLGISVTAQVGISADAIVGGGLGIGGFMSLDDPSLRGTTWYVGGSMSDDVLELVDLNGEMLTYSPYETTRKSYVLQGSNRINYQELVKDILTGDGTVWGFNIPIANYGNLSYSLNNKAITASRLYGVFLALRNITAYEEIHNANGYSKD